MPERSCPSCRLEVAAHQTLCPRCRAAIPTEAGPVAASAEASSVTLSAPPPRAPRPGGTPSAVDATGDHDLPAADPGVAPGPGDPAEQTVVRGGSTVGPAPAGPGWRRSDTSSWGPPSSLATPWGSAPPSAPSAGTLGVPGAPSLDDRGNLPGGIVGVLGVVLVVVGIVLPWLDVAGETVSGWAASDDAKILSGVAGIAAVAAALVVGGARSLVLRILLGLAGLVALGLGVVDRARVGGIEDLDPSPGVGFVAVLAGGALLVLAGALTRHRRFR